MENPVRNLDTSQLHISYSQIFTYLACSLKYQFRYVLSRPPERISLALVFGSALHKALERYYRSYANGVTERLDILQDLFAEVLTRQIEEKPDLVVYTKQTPDTESAIALGTAMLKAFYESIDLKGFKIVATELCLSAVLYTDQAEPTDFHLVGAIDLLLKDPAGNLLVVDHKSAARTKTQADVDADLQMTAYSYLLCANRYLFPTAPVKCRFDVLRKLKTPTLEHYHTQRTADDRRRLARIATQVLKGIEAKIFVPSRSWLCTDCEYAGACTDWHRF